tara:strand:- start:4754 stop:6643 length:1890 start_codon:yes stop_codon:yes gene_type:complete
MAVQNKDITYINKSFNDIRSQLINFSQTYFPNTYTDFSPASPGVMFIEQASYVSDVLSFYLDNQIQETYIQYARQFDNLYDLAYMFSYKPKVTGLATVDLDFYQQLPSKTEGSSTVPDFDYALYIGTNTTATSANGSSFVTSEPVDFTVSNSMDQTEISIAQINNDEPEYYLLKKTRKGTSGTIVSETFTMGAYQEFPTLELNVPNIGGIIDITDSDGNIWYEVDYLAQDLVYSDLKNTNVNDPNNSADSYNAPYLLKTKSVNRRFITRFLNENTLQIQFGAGRPLEIDEEVTPNPDNVGLGLPFGQNKLTTAYSPTNFIFTNTYGISPSDTNLTVRYLTGGGTSSNVNANQINILSTTNTTFINSNLNSSLADFIFNSLAVNNVAAASGGQDGDSIEEIRQNSLSNYNTQQRNVTADDYLVRALSMPPSYGTIARAHTQKPLANDPNTTLDLYVLSFDLNKKLINGSNTLKSNLQTYINQYRMIGDVVNIKDAFVINICCNFDIITLPNFNNNEVLFNCIAAVREYFNINRWQINQPIILRDISVLLDRIPGVQTVSNVNIENKAGTTLGYSQYAYSISGATQGGIIYPSIDPSIFEVKYPDTDIKGRVVALGVGTFTSGTGTQLGGY